MEINKLPLHALKQWLMLAIVYEETTFIFTGQFTARLLEYYENNKMHVSRSYYNENFKRYQQETMNGLKCSLPDKEPDMIRTLLRLRWYYGRPQNDIKIGFTYISTVANACKKCKGKGFIDWVEEIMEPSWDSFVCDEEVNASVRTMLKSFKQYEYHNEVSVFYRNRNFNHPLIKECKSCPECFGVGFDPADLETYIPSPIIDQIITSVKSDIKLRMQPPKLPA